jgi:hypothetical protein
MTGMTPGTGAAPPPRFQSPRRTSRNCVKSSPPGGPKQLISSLQAPNSRPPVRQRQPQAVQSLSAPDRFLHHRAAPTDAQFVSLTPS